MKHVLVSLACLTLTVASCAATKTSVTVRGKDDDVFRMRGEWVGEYTSEAIGRSGSIRFALTGGRHAASGHITMPLPEGGTRELHIASMRIKGAEMTGDLEQYLDPSCKCQVETQFVGTMVEDSIDGVFTVKPVGAPAGRQGTWHAERLNK